MPPNTQKAFVHRFPRHAHSSSPRDRALMVPELSVPETTAIEWTPPALGRGSCCQSTAKAQSTADPPLLKAKSLGALSFSERRDARSPKARNASKTESLVSLIAPSHSETRDARRANTHSASKAARPESMASRHPGHLGTQEEHRKSKALLFPFWQIEQSKQETGLEAHHGDVDEEQRSLAQRLFQAERCLAEKDQRIEALEACTARLAERLDLAEGLAAAMPRQHQKEPSTPGSTRSTAGSTVWTSSDMIQFCPLRRNRTMESLCSAGSATAPGTPKAPKARNICSVGALPKSLDVGNNKQQTIWGANGPYASAADIDGVFRRSEQLLKAMTASIAQGERRSPRTSVPSASTAMRPRTPRAGELSSSSKFITLPADLSTRILARQSCG
eukprot:TRINITY_DN21153_c0_g1_i1.p1 TRINITY_DN21153_c0_g1~~TRINITY_DN21153_c0_g1_i1.p1  ORF type:complete len:389 (-),score=57.43 TRINITY_DN21153_c0_g1_i1:244-1410(-)